MTDFDGGEVMKSVVSTCLPFFLTFFLTASVYGLNRFCNVISNMNHGRVCFLFLDSFSCAKTYFESIFAKKRRKLWNIGVVKARWRKCFRLRCKKVNSIFIAHIFSKHMLMTCDDMQVTLKLQGKNKLTPKATDIFLIKTISCQHATTRQLSPVQVEQQVGSYIKQLVGEEGHRTWVWIIFWYVDFCVELLCFGMDWYGVFIFFVQTLLNPCACRHVCFPFQWSYYFYFLNITYR